MATVAVVGTQWGDEGKGKITDLLASRADIIVRYQGGNNAGHTVKIGDELFKLHLIPSGIFYSGKLSVIGNGVVVDPGVLIQEMEALASKGVDLSGLRVSDRAHVIMPYHVLLDKLEEEARGTKRIGTVAKGIGPAYTDKIARRGIRIADLVDEEAFRERLDAVLPHKNKEIERLYGGTPFSKADIVEEYLGYGRRIKPYVVDCSSLLNDAIDRGKHILFEGAQGTLLDVDHGTYPYVTSSWPTAGGAAAGTGVGPTRIGRVVGVAKAYTTRVGQGPFPTEIDGPLQDELREKGMEYGTTSGRARRCGWFDAVGVRYAARVNGLWGLAVMHLDTLSGFPTVRICTGYKLGDKVLTSPPSTIKALEACVPVYEELEGWPEGTCKVERYEDLPGAARRYLARISELIGVPIAIVSVGRERSETIVIKEPFEGSPS
ncbi:MAG TPA: adenylosuccinate synthase [Firmicutes bacterium]|nr:adenylosuccinate synthase [Bacillota bacterium]